MISLLAPQLLPSVPWQALPPCVAAMRTFWPKVMAVPVSSARCSCTRKMLATSVLPTSLRSTCGVRVSAASPAGSAAMPRLAAAVPTLMAPAVRGLLKVTVNASASSSTWSSANRSTISAEVRPSGTVTLWPVSAVSAVASPPMKSPGSMLAPLIA